MEKELNAYDVGNLRNWTTVKGLQQVRDLKYSRRVHNCKHSRKYIYFLILPILHVTLAYLRNGRYTPDIPFN